MRMADADARRRFAAARVARMATVSEAGAPHLVPVTFAVVETLPGIVRTDPAALIVYAVDHKPKSTTALRRLENIASNPQVSFLVDSYDEDWDRLWWVRADALSETLDGRARLRAIAALRGKYRQYESTPPDGVVVGSTVVRWSGWLATL